MPQGGGKKSRKLKLSIGGRRNQKEEGKKKAKPREFCYVRSKKRALLVVTAKKQKDG